MSINKVSSIMCNNLIYKLYVRASNRCSEVIALIPPVLLLVPSKLHFINIVVIISHCDINF